MRAQHERELHNAYLEGRSKGFEDGKRDADELQERIKELEEIINYATDGIDALSPYLSTRAAKDMKAIKETLEKANNFYFWHYPANI